MWKLYRMKIQAYNLWLFVNPEGNIAFTRITALQGWLYNGDELEVYKGKEAKSVMQELNAYKWVKQSKHTQEHLSQGYLLS